MIIKRIVKVIILSILVHKSESECFCTQRGQEVTCNHNLRNQDASFGIDQVLSTKTAFPFQDIKVLHLHCSITTLSANWVVNQEFLRELDLSTNNISRVPNDFFNSLSQLEVLNMSHNLLRNPSGNAFKAIKNLHILDLSFNRISSVDRQILDGMPQLQKLYVSHNGLFELPSESFEENIKIQELDLSHNHIRSIDKLQFKYNPELEIFNFAQNDLYGEVELETFGYAKKLKYLNLSNSNIKLIPELFINNVNIAILDLSKNSFQNLPQNIFNPLVNLETLNLASCQLLNIEKDLLHQNQKLKKLDLSGNNLRKFPNQFFDRGQNLETLNISKNLFRTISDNVFQKTVLVTLDISGNLLSDITPNLLNVPTLESVYLQNNKLSQLNGLSRSLIPSPIKYLNLEFNQIVFLRPELFNVLKNLKEIEILNNPWNCRCFEELLEVLIKKNVKYKVGHYYEGTVPICVTSDSCNYDETNLNYYYDIYITNFK